MNFILLMTVLSVGILSEYVVPDLHDIAASRTMIAIQKSFMYLIIMIVCKVLCKVTDFLSDEQIGS
ncbi:MAG TPA: hypothetical protein DEO38_00070 [Bacteroidales bacterium]|nr:hypothetical protein [Bacteroidales bacterium]